MNHLDEMTAFLYLDSQLESAQASEISSHAQSCSECRALLESLKKETLWLEQSLREKDPVPAQFAAPVRHLGFRWGWITALGMAAAGILTVWNGMIEPFERQLNQAGFSGGNLMTMLFFSGAFWKGWSSVLSFLEFFSLAVFLMLVFALLQRYWRHGAALGMVLATISLFSLLLFFLSAPAAHAGEVVHGKPNYTLPSGQTVNTDLFVFGDFDRIDGTVNGDVFAWGNEVQINGHVTGDVFAFSRELTVNGTVDGNIRNYTQTLNINGTVGKNVLAGCQDFEVNPKAQIGGSITLGSANAMISGTVGRDIMAAVDAATINGPVAGSIKIHGDRLHIGSKADVHGPFTYKGIHKAIVDPGATLSSPLVFTQSKQGPNYASWKYYWHRIEFWAAAFLFGLVFLLLAPRFFASGLHSSKRYLPSFGFGILFLIATPIVAILISITFVGLALGITTLLLWLIAVYAAQTFVGSWIGEALLGPAAGTGSLIGRLALGLAILHGLEMIPYHVGIIIHFIILCWGLGAIAMAIFGYLRRSPSVPPVVASA